jgi:hypothetical protein
MSASAAAEAGMGEGGVMNRREGRSRGGHARAASMTPEQRRAAAQHAAWARWARPRAPKQPAVAVSWSQSSYPSSIHSVTVVVVCGPPTVTMQAFPADTERWAQETPA